MVKKPHLVNLIKLRVAIGLLGESRQSTWWPSAFFSGASSAFLAPVFGRTSLLARYHGVREAAAIVHDDHIGTAEDVFHLFRLPERFERELHELLGDADVANDVANVVRDEETAEEYVQGFSKKTAFDSIGPVRIGATSEIEKPSAWQVVTQHYLNAFQTGSQVFPYFKSEP